ncbi:MAG TPA: hypothetical protein VIJ51_04570 [Solirubrobacteraceae bacterium]
MEAFVDPERFPEPAWLAGQSDPVIEGMLEVLSDEARGLYRRYLAEEIRSTRSSGPGRPWRAFDRALFEVLRRRQEEREV